jgi:RHS repeat-associated protein
VYDGLDHLVRWSSSINSQEEWYLYDASGERVLRRSYDGTTTTLIVYAFGEEEHQYAYSGSGSSATNTSNTYYYDLGGQLLGTWDGASTATTFLLADTLGSVVSSFNNLASGAQVLGDQVYGPYGNQRTQQGTIGTSKGFTGQYNDWLTGLDYYGARYYDPVIGQFLSADVVQGNVQGLDPYSYVGDNPESRTDPTGQRFIAGDDPGTSATGVITPTGTVSVTPDRGSPTIWWVSYAWPTFFPALSFHLPNAASIKHVFADVSHVAPVSHASAVHKKSASAGGDPGLGSCGQQQASCGNYGMYHAVYMGPFTWGVPGSNCIMSCGDIVRGDVNIENESVQEDVNGEDTSDYGSEGCSFTSQTKVATKDGEQSIGTVQGGEEVWAYNPKTKKMELQPILHVWLHQDNDLVDLTITSTAHAKQGTATKSSSEVVHTNQKHPFLTVEKGFLPVGQITVGMHVVEADGSLGVISGWKVVPGVQTMYNLEVAQDHTFTVGDGQWIVHNTGPECDGVESQGPGQSESEPVGSFTKVKDSYLKKLGIDAHAFKKGILGSGAPISHFDIYKDGNGDLYLLTKDGSKSNAIPTYVNIDDPHS